MKKAKVIKIWPAAHVELRLHVSKKMEEDFKVCQELSKKAMTLDDDFPECEKCSWNDIEINGKGYCTMFAENIQRQLEK